ncbi:hypothetical protein GGR50DRAFT_330667 [Xylaria sp. CBS 124048]|nr:hypothetical protein GGR50DRAFT_330667 [Xylaria sp. CBS 124048]
MPRILPWKRHESEAPQLPKPARSIPDRRATRDDAGPVLNEVDSAPSSDAGSQSKKTLKRPRRSGSTSPPPAPLQEIFMIEGAENDDRYRMVEDELLATAQLFTAHLHAAEYKRLKKASELENAQTIRNISRPVIGQTTDMVKIKRERGLLKEKQRLAVRKARNANRSGDESTGTDDPKDSWQKASLHGLMESQGELSPRLDGLLAIAPKTRAAAGFSRQTTDRASSNWPKLAIPTESNSDLDATNRPVNRTSKSTSRSLSLPGPKASDAKNISYNATTVHSPKASQLKTEEKEVSSDDEGIDFMARLKKRKEKRRQSREQRQSRKTDTKLDSGDILPDFL